MQYVGKFRLPSIEIKDKLSPSVISLFEILERTDQLTFFQYGGLCIMDFMFQS